MNSERDLIHIGSTLKSLREERGYTVRELANLAEVPYPYLSKIENDKANPTLDMIDRICYSLDVKISDVFLKNELEKDIRKEKRKLYKDFKPIIRRLNNLASKLYGDENSDNDDELGDIDNNRIHPIVGGGFNIPKQVEHSK